MSALLQRAASACYAFGPQQEMHALWLQRSAREQVALAKACTTLSATRGPVWLSVHHKLEIESSMPTACRKELRREPTPVTSKERATHLCSQHPQLLRAERLLGAPKTSQIAT